MVDISKKYPLKNFCETKIIQYWWGSAETPAPNTLKSAAEAC